jgi:hypothetical protein
VGRFVGGAYTRPSLNTNKGGKTLSISRLFDGNVAAKDVKACFCAYTNLFRTLGYLITGSFYNFFAVVVFREKPHPTKVEITSG